MALHNADDKLDADDLCVRPWKKRKTFPGGGKEAENLRRDKSRCRVEEHSGMKQLYESQCYNDISVGKLIKRTHRNLTPSLDSQSNGTFPPSLFYCNKDT